MHYNVSISYEGSLREIALSDASKLASTYFSLFHRSVHVLYTEMCILMHAYIYSFYMYPGWLPLRGGQSVPEGSRNPVVFV